MDDLTTRDAATLVTSPLVETVSAVPNWPKYPSVLTTCSKGMALGSLFAGKPVSGRPLNLVQSRYSSRMSCMRFVCDVCFGVCLYIRLCLLIYIYIYIFRGICRACPACVSCVMYVLGYVCKFVYVCKSTYIYICIEVFVANILHAFRV